MRFLRSDMFKAFAVGFALGALGLCVVFGGGELMAMAGRNVVPSALAAPAR